jgi:hypothetical protein
VSGSPEAALSWRAIAVGVFERLRAVFARWRLNFSHQLVLSVRGELTAALYENLPMSVAVDLDSASFCALLLREDTLKFADKHTLGFRSPIGGGNSIIRPETDEHFAALCAERIGSDVPLPFTIGWDAWRSVCREGSTGNAALRGMGFDWEFTPHFLRWKVAAATVAGLTECVRFYGVEKAVIEGVTRFVRGTSDAVALYFVEWVTGEWGVTALMASAIPEIAVVPGGRHAVSADSRTHVVEVGPFGGPDEVLRALLAGLQAFLDERYG